MNLEQTRQLMERIRQERGDEFDNLGIGAHSPASGKYGTYYVTGYNHAMKRKMGCDKPEDYELFLAGGCAHHWALGLSFGRPIITMQCEHCGKCYRVDRDEFAQWVLSKTGA